MESVTGRPWQILVVDDDEDDFLLLSEMLRELWKDCVNVHWHSIPEGVIEKVCSRQFEAAIIDSHLDGVGGIQLIEQIRLQCPNAVLLLSSDWPDQNLRAEAIRRGATSYIDKNSITAEDLGDQIKRAILT